MPARTPYLTPAEAADLLRVDVKSIYRSIAKGEIPHLRVGRMIRIPRAAIDAMTRAAS
jgi:excisionase family DNA binding protein